MRAALLLVFAGCDGDAACRDFCEKVDETLRDCNLGEGDLRDIDVCTENLEPCSRRDCREMGDSIDYAPCITASVYAALFLEGADVDCNGDDGVRRHALPPPSLAASMPEDDRGDDDGPFHARPLAPSGAGVPEDGHDDDGDRGDEPDDDEDDE